MLSNVWFVQFDRVRRRKWMVGLCILLCLMAGGFSVVTEGTSYTSQATLGMASPNRGPEQDAILAEGYVNFFNEPAYQGVLKQRAGVPDDVSFEAQSVASSPLIDITATSPHQADVRTASGKMAEALRDTVNQSLQATKAEAVAQIRRSFGDTKSGGSVPDQLLIDMEDRISALNSDTTNELQMVQMRSEVTATSAPVGQTLGLALLAGLVLGCAIALSVGALSRRVDSQLDLTEKLGLNVLGVLPPSDESERARRFGHLANALRCGASGGSQVLAVASARDMPGASLAAWAIAEHRANQGLQVALIDADLRSASTARGLADYLLAAESLEARAYLRPPSRPGGVSEFRSGRAVEEIRGLDVTRFDLLLTELRREFDVVVIITPPLVESAESQLICAAADTVLLVAEQSRTRTVDLIESRRLLEQVQGHIAGSLLIEKNALNDIPDWTSDTGSRVQLGERPVADSAPAANAAGAAGPDHHTDASIDKASTNGRHSVLAAGRAHGSK